LTFILLENSMPFTAALPKGVELRPEEVAATFVVPAPSGCNLNCSFCVVRARREARPGDVILGEDDYLAFLRALDSRFPLGLVSLQGYEPLLPESWAYSAAILSTGNKLGHKTAIVTNGTHLYEHVWDLVNLNVTAVTVSLDSSVPEQHDQSRRTSGAYAATMKGLRLALASPMAERLLVASVLQPDKRHFLDGMPELLGSLGVEKWIVTPMYKITATGFGGPTDAPEQIVSDLIDLQNVAKRHGVQMLVDDELNALTTRAGKVVSIHELQLRRMKRLDQVVRLSPSGAFSVGQGILSRVGAATPMWQPKIEKAEAFLSHALDPSHHNKIIPISRFAA